MDAYDTGLLVINGIGAHPPTQTLDAMMEPLLARMRAEGSSSIPSPRNLVTPKAPEASSMPSSWTTGRVIHLRIGNSWWSRVAGRACTENPT